VCFYAPGVREQYPSVSKFAPKRKKVKVHAGYVVPEATAALPGTAAKVAILEQRAARKESLWHPDDPVWLPDLG
jgi:hypothetical protein